MSAVESPATSKYVFNAIGLQLCLNSHRRISKSRAVSLGLVAVDRLLSLRLSEYGYNLRS